MQIILLMESKMYPIPESIKVLEEYGHESIADDKGRIMASGTVSYLEGEAGAIAAWLYPFDSIWQCSSPAIGDWQAIHVRLEYTLEVSHNSGMSYTKTHQTTDLSDPELLRLIDEYKAKDLRYCVTDQYGNFHVVCPQHEAALKILDASEKA